MFSRILKPLKPLGVSAFGLFSLGFAYDTYTVLQHEREVMERLSRREKFAFQPVPLAQVQQAKFDEEKQLWKRSNASLLSELEFYNHQYPFIVYKKPSHVLRDSIKSRKDYHCIKSESDKNSLIYEGCKELLGEIEKRQDGPVVKLKQELRDKWLERRYRK